MARPSSYTEEIAAELCERISKGEALHRICDEPEKPSTTAVYHWLERNQEFRDKYARARELQAEHYAAQIIEIADTAEDPAKGRLQVDARKWVASKLLPKKYGDRLEGEVKHTGSLSVRWLLGGEDESTNARDSDSLPATASVRSIP